MLATLHIMKALPILAFLAALVALVFSSLPFELASSMLFVAGFAAILAADYTRRPLLQTVLVSPVCPMTPVSQGKPEPAFELAA